MLDEIYQEQKIVIVVVVVYGRNTPEAADSKEGKEGECMYINYYTVK